MTTDWRERVRLKHRDRTSTVLAGLDQSPQTELEYETDLRRYRLDALRAYDPDAALGEELRLRVLGAEAHGTVRFTWGPALMKPVQETVSAAARGEVDLELLGVSQGSTVMHVRPVPVLAPADALPAPVDSSRADAAIRDVLAFTDALEHEEDVRPFQHILDAAARLTEVLDEYDLAVDLRWLAADGTARESRITNTGRQYAARLRRTRETTTRITVSGRITELRESGIVKIKAGPHKTSTAYEVRMASDDLMDMRLVIGQQVSFVVTERRQVDSFDRTHKHEYDFVGRAHEETTLDITPSTES